MKTEPKIHFLSVSRKSRIIRKGNNVYTEKGELIFWHGQEEYEANEKLGKMLKKQKAEEQQLEAMIEYQARLNDWSKEQARENVLAYREAMK